MIREVGMDPEKTNVNGGAIALGHPDGATGTKLTVQLIHDEAPRLEVWPCHHVHRRQMGAAGIFGEPAELSWTAFLGKE